MLKQFRVELIGKLARARASEARLREDLPGSGMKLAEAREAVFVYEVSLRATEDAMRRREESQKAEDTEQDKVSLSAQGSDSMAARMAALEKRVASLQERKPNPFEHIEKLLYSRKEAAHVLSMSVSSIDLMIGDKRLGRRVHGRRVLIPAADVRRISRQDDSRVRIRGSD